MKKIKLFLAVFFIFAVLTGTAKAGKRGYLNIGGDPLNPNRQLAQSEIEQVATVDFFVEINSSSGKISRGWTKAGEVFVTIPTNNLICPFEKCRVAKWIKRCGNDLVGKTAPGGMAQIFFKEPEVVATPEKNLALPQKTTVAVAPVAPVVYKGEKAEEVCFGLGTLSTGLGSAGIAYGILAHQPLVAGIGLGLGILGIWDPFDPQSDPRCKAAAGLVGGFGGYLLGGRGGGGTSSGETGSPAGGGGTGGPAGGGGTGGPVGGGGI